MKKILAITSVVVVLFLCAFKIHSGDGWKSYGEKITADNAIETTDLVAKMGTKDTLYTKIHGTSKEVCQVKGCWMTIPVSGVEKAMRVRFKDYGFFVPKTAGGKEVIAEGKAYYEVVSVEMLQHYAKDARKSALEIAAITLPEKNLMFLASGVLIKE